MARKKKATPNGRSRPTDDAIGRDEQLTWTPSGSHELFTEDDDELFGDDEQLSEYDVELWKCFHANPSRPTARRLAERIKEEMALRKALEDPLLDF